VPFGLLIFVYRSTLKIKGLRMLTPFQRRVVAGLSLFVCMAAGAQTGELSPAQLAVIKQKLSQRLPDLPPIESARTTPMNGLIELKAGASVLYTDANGDYLIEGQLLDTKSQRNLTEERLDEINKVDFGTLPFKDAVVWKSGTGKRRLVVFADPGGRLQGQGRQHLVRGQQPHPGLARLDAQRRGTCPQFWHVHLAGPAQPGLVAKTACARHASHVL